MSEHGDVLGWIPPRGGMTAFPWLVSGEDARPFCQAATRLGVLLAPGDCFDEPSHFRLGFAAAGSEFQKALDRFGAFVESWRSAGTTRNAVAADPGVLPGVLAGVLSHS